MLQSVVVPRHFLARVLDKLTVYIFWRAAALTPVQYKFWSDRFDELICDARSVHDFDGVSAWLPLLIELSGRLDLKCRMCLLSLPGRYYMSGKSGVL